MKLRIKGNTLRLRLTQKEVATLAREGRYAERMQLADAALDYVVRTRPGGGSVAAAFADGRITVTLPASSVQQWARSEQVSLSATHGPLSILVEKDFACLKPRPDEDESDMFPHPAQSGS